MSRHDDLIENLNKSTIFCSNLGLGEQGSVLSKLKRAIYICPDIEKARQMQKQLSALNQDNVLIDEFSRPFTLSKFQSNESKIDLLKTIYKLSLNESIVISTPHLLFSFLPDLQIFKEIKTSWVFIYYIEYINNVTTAREFTCRSNSFNFPITY